MVRKISNVKVETGFVVSSKAFIATQKAIFSNETVELDSITL